MTIQLFKTKVHQEAIDNVNQVLTSGWLGLGPVVEEFENAFAKYTGAKYAVAFSSGTAALHVAAHLLELDHMSPVVSTPMTFVSSNHVLLYEGYHIRFADIDLSTGNLDLYHIHQACKYYHPKALMFVHYAGNTGDLDLLYEIADMYKLTIIEDAAHAAGARYYYDKSDQWEMVGKRAKFACFSFHAVKNLALGDGGMLTTTDEEIAVRARSLRWLGIDKSTSDRVKGGLYGWKYNVTSVGYKSYMNDINAAIGLGQLVHLDADNSRRKEIYHMYQAAGVPVLHAPRGSSHHMVVMLADNSKQKEKIMQALVDNDIQYGCHYTPNYYYNMYKNVPRENECADTEEFYSRCITLPTHLYLSNDDVCKVAEVIQGVRKKCNGWKGLAGESLLCS